MKTNQFLLFFIILIFCHCEDEEEDFSEQCKRETTKEGCKAVDLDSPYYQCCYTNYTDSKNGEFEWKSLNDALYEVYSKSTTYYYRRETIGFECYNEGDPSKESFCDEPEDNYYVYECKKGTVYDMPEFSIFSEAEKNILRDENHCFSIAKLAFSGSDVEINKNDCFNAKLTESTKNSGVTCAFLEYEFTTTAQNKFKGTTCYLFNSYLARQDDKLKSFFDDIGKDLFKEKRNDASLVLKSYTVSLSDSLSQSASYNSETGTFDSHIIDNGNRAKKKRSDQKIINISFGKLLILFLLIYL